MKWNELCIFRLSGGDRQWHVLDENLSLRQDIEIKIYKRYRVYYCNVIKYCYTTFQSKLKYFYVYYFDDYVYQTSAELTFFCFLRYPLLSTKYFTQFEFGLYALKFTENWLKDIRIIISNNKFKRQNLT